MAGVGEEAWTHKGEPCPRDDMFCQEKTCAACIKAEKPDKRLDFQTVGLIDGDYIMLPRDARVDRVKLALDLMRDVAEDDYDPLASMDVVVEAIRRRLA